MKKPPQRPKRQPKQTPRHGAPRLGRAAQAALRHHQQQHHKPQPKHPKPGHPVPRLGKAAQAAMPAHQHHKPVKKPPKAQGPIKRGLAIAGDVACCAAEALAASLRLTGWPVSDVDVFALYQLTAGSPDAGAAILATLEAAAEHGLAGVQPVSFQPVDLDEPAAVLLGVDLPGAHTVCVDGGTWWSWGEQYDPAVWPAAVIEEAWEVTW